MTSRGLGFVRKRNTAPLLTAEMADSTSACPVSMTRTVSGDSSWTLARKVIPSIFGILRSDTTTAYGPEVLIFSNPSSGPLAVSTLNCLRSDAR